MKDVTHLAGVAKSDWKGDQVLKNFYSRFFGWLTTTGFRQTLASFVIVIASGPATADMLVYGNLSASEPFYSASGTGIPAGIETANFFVPTSTVELTRVLLPLDLTLGSASSLSVSLYANSGSAPALSALVLGALSYSAAGLSEVTFAPGTALLVGNTYWLGVASGIGTQVTWRDATPSATVSEPYRLTSGAAVWQANIGSKGALEVYGTTPVPLPAAAWLLLSGVGGIGALARRHQAFRHPQRSLQSLPKEMG